MCRETHEEPWSNLTFVGEDRNKSHKFHLKKKRPSQTFIKLLTPVESWVFKISDFKLNTSYLLLSGNLLIFKVLNVKLCLHFFTTMSYCCIATSSVVKNDKSILIYSSIFFHVSKICCEHGNPTTQSNSFWVFLKCSRFKNGCSNFREDWRIAAALLQKTLSFFQ